MDNGQTDKPKLISPVFFKKRVTKIKDDEPGGDDGLRALLNNATIGTIELVEAFEEALP